MIIHPETPFPNHLEHGLFSIRHARATDQEPHDNHRLQGTLHHTEDFPLLISHSSPMQETLAYAKAIANSGETILITGETGVGKGILAKTIHHISQLSGEFISINVAELEDALLSDTLYGHCKGAFPGADSAREGLVARAQGGTLFLDEIGDLKPKSQLKLLRLLKEKNYYPLGSDLPRQNHARIITATHHDFHKMTTSGAFRTDLYFRLTSHQIDIPPLRNRTEDIPLLLAHFTQEAATTMRKPCPEIPPQLLTLLSTYPFPGNVRELRAMAFDAVARHQSGSTLSIHSFRQAMGIHSHPSPAKKPPTHTHSSDHGELFATGPLPTLKDGINKLIHEAMRRANNNQGIAASLLGITRQSLNRRLINLRNKE